MIYLTHIVVRDLVNAKINRRKYNSLIDPDELTDFLNRFKDPSLSLENNFNSKIDNFSENINKDNRDLNIGTGSFYSNNMCSNYSEYSRDY